GHGGRVVDAPGDNVLAEFASVVDAVQCAIDVQRELQSRNAELPLARQMRFRIGINLGDIIVEGERLYGDGVNIAARLESLADAGRFCLPGPASGQTGGKPPFGCEFAGEPAVKNIARPVRVYRLRLDSTARSRPVLRRKLRGARATAGALVVLALLAGVGWGGWRWLRPLPSAGPPPPHRPPLALPPLPHPRQDPPQEDFRPPAAPQFI